MGAMSVREEQLYDLNMQLIQITGVNVLVRYNLETELIEITYVTDKVARTETIKEENIDRYIEYVKNPGTNLFNIGFERG
ncbi:hypothetical protein [Inconstantimicrobium mannanitabidum]|uniref:Uncharacterized protein n=1 Tax=Inconstantimicrobium mannanitabidum TaxID=1604901 RepID=A0ACB5RC94_9CLOT|nr:hypothetical protein [Clostridium sp. TW13]GKX66877.1 hypothetical protein rsdtw13_21350 [Clostridium sp. TW13]